MKKLLFLAPAILVGLSTMVAAQSSVIPAGYAATEGTSSTSYPWNTSNMRVQYCYDTTNFAGHTAPIIINELHWRANGGTGNWAGGSHSGVTIEMSSSPFDQAVQTTTFATNHGLDRAKVFSGTVTVSPNSSTTSPRTGYYVKVKLATPFLYDPTKGKDLVIDISTTTRTGSTYSMDAASTGSLTSRMYAFTSTALTGSTQQNVGAVVKMVWTPAKGLYAGFDADKKVGAGPLSVQFTDKTFTSDPGGVKTWAWDLNGDSKIDSTIQNPKFLYPSIMKTATYDVSLTVTDASHPSSSITKKAFITIDPPPVADFDVTPKAGGAPHMVQFTDKSTAAATWAWDFDNNNSVDATIQNPKYVYGTAGTYSVKLTVTNPGGSDSITKLKLINVLAPGQSAQTVPAGYLATEGPSSTSYAWGSTSLTGHRIQYCYDKTHLKSTTPIIIQKLRFRANASTATWTGGTFNNVSIQMSTCTSTPAMMSTTFATNHGLDKTAVYQGNVTVSSQTTPDPSSPRTSWYIDVQLQKGFLYDPTKGDLLFDLTLPAGLAFGTSYYPDYVSGTTAGAYYMYSYSSATSPTGSGPYSGGMIIELTYSKAALNAMFTAKPTIGAAPMKVQFTDQSYSNQTGGVTSWAWDFDGDSKVDSTLQNPSFTYLTVNKTANYDVTLTVTDGTNPASSVTMKNFITVDPAPVADFSATPRSGAVRTGMPPMMVQFTDLSAGASSWAWDLNGDTVIDSTVQNPRFAYAAAGKYSVTLTASSVGGSDKITKASYIVVDSAQSLKTLLAGGNGLSSGTVGNMFDINVKNPGGLWVTEVDMHCRAAVATTLDVYICPTTYVGNHGTAAAWTKVGSASRMSIANPTSPYGAVTRFDIGDFHLPFGKYGMAVFVTNGAGVHYTNGTGTNQTFTTTDMTLTAGYGVSGPFSTGFNNPRVWNGALYYVTRGWAASGPYGTGCKGSNGIPTLAAAPGASPILGANYKANLTNLPTAGGSVLILVGFNKAKLMGAIPLPFDMTPLGATGCNILTDISLNFGAANVAGAGSFIIAIPKIPELVGGYLTSQAVILDTAANTMGITVSNGGEMHIGQ